MAHAEQMRGPHNPATSNSRSSLAQAEKSSAAKERPVLVWVLRKALGMALPASVTQKNVTKDNCSCVRPPPTPNRGGGARPLRSR